MLHKKKIRMQMTEDLEYAAIRCCVEIPRIDLGCIKNKSKYINYIAEILLNKGLANYMK